MILNTLVKEIENQKLIIIPTGKKLYHGLRRKESQSYFKGTHWLTSSLFYGVDYAFKVDLPIRDIIVRDLLICETTKDLRLVDMSNINMNRLTEKLNSNHNTDLNDRWVKSHFIENAEIAFNEEIHGYLKCTDVESDEYLICNVEVNLNILNTID
jgi:hypothetical protein